MPVLGIHDVLEQIRMRILGSVPLTNRSGCEFRRPKTYGSNESGSEFGTLVHIHHSYKKSSVADPGCLSRIPDPDFYPSRIPDPKTATKERGEKN
jgi:hypothetical protein